MSTKPVLAGFHGGELSVQRRAGSERQAARQAGMLAPAQLSGGAARFLAQRTFAVLTARDANGTLWTSPLLAKAGFLRAEDTTLAVRTTPAEGDPLSGLPAGQPAALLAMEFAIRRRFRVNGTILASDADGLLIEAEQAFGNCPAYIQTRELNIQATTGGTRATSLTAEDRKLIRAADTFFLGSIHQERGADTSHKGGQPGFVRIDGDDLWWPDYAGNNMFNSMGNIAVNPEASVLFLDFTSGATVQLSGTASLEWVAPGSDGEDDSTGRRIRFHPELVVSARAVPR